ncbi:CDP-glycerol glycerophosphotransferase family protein [Terrilactibacillus sp. S3-3]|nr:CDP-glycerol glycerophosphotransferase family protein [Terrilactibacillus sp. S3-3]
MKSHDVYSIFSGHVLDTGYPRIDLMFKADKEKIRKTLSVPAGKKVILYAPTWRGKLSSMDDMSQQLLNEMRQIQENVSEEYIVLLKSHYYAYQFFEEKGLEHLCVPNNIDTNEVLSIVDILITDYSSIFFDFLSSRKPIIYYAYDFREYEENRGMYIDMKDLPGPLCMNMENVIQSINEIDNVRQKYHNRYEAFIQRFCYHDDGKATERFVEIVFEGKASEDCFKVETNKTKILIYAGGFYNNGITSSVTNLLNNIDYNKYDVTVVDYGNDTRKEKWAHLEKLNQHVKILYRVGTWNAMLSEWYKHNLF